MPTIYEMFNGAQLLYCHVTPRKDFLLLQSINDGSIASKIFYLTFKNLINDRKDKEKTRART